LCLQNSTVRVRGDRYRVPIDHRSIAGHVAETGEMVFIDDVYAPQPGRPFAFNPDFDRQSGFTTRSMLCFALINGRGAVIGVVQLMNATDGFGDVVPFDRGFGRVVGPVNHIVGHAIERADALERIARANAALRERNRALREQQQRIAALQGETEQAFMLSVELLARAAEIHDEETGNHILRVNRYAEALARLAGCSDAFCREIGYSAALHDVGKMSVDVAVLRKRGGLTAEERAEMQRHPAYGWQILSASPRLAMAAEIAHAHHEQWGGGGYPRALRGEEIPLAARIVAIGDIYDALRSARPYKPAFSHERTVQIMTQGDERIDPAAHFDPRLLAVFARHHGAFDAIWDELRDAGQREAAHAAAL
ncbi:MAG TPA: HD domain-containing phosphohydrolase, partial [Alphaproteobacteria bacterium]|nr:HD domain-containing phosphohydrolase [Alphaproteobacteria bacterium]